MSHSFIDPKNDYYNYNDNSDTTQKKIDPVAQLKWLNTPQVHGGWGLFNQPAGRQGNQPVQKATQENKQDDKIFKVPTGWGLNKIADHLGVTVKDLIETNQDKIKTWGNVQGFNAGELINIPSTNKKETVKSETELILDAYMQFKSGTIGMPEMARSLLPYLSTNVSAILNIFDSLPWSQRDNLAYALAANSSDSELQSVPKELLNRMSSELSNPFSTTSWAENSKQKERIKKVNSTAENKSIYNLKDRENGINFIKNNKNAYLKGYELWKAGKRGNVDYNNILIVHKDASGNDNLKVYRKFTNGVYYFIDKEILTDKEYTEEKDLTTAKNTYCNIAATKIGLEYGAPNLQNHGGKEHTANSIFENFKKGFYNTDSSLFEKTTYQNAETYASKGGLAYVIWKNPAGIGHIATLIGGYGGNGEKIMSNLKIFQAGSSFGEMTYSKGFGSSVVSDFYIWKKK